MVIRDLRPGDIPRIRELHETSGIDYRFPDLLSPLFLVTKVAEEDGIIRAAGGLYLQTEAYLWIEQGGWADPQTKMEVIRRLNAEACHEAWLKGIDCAVLWLPPGMERFGNRLEQIGFHLDRGWATYSRKLGE